MDGVYLDPTKYGWRLIDGQLEPIATLLPVATSSLLKLSKCSGAPALKEMYSVLGTADVTLASVKIEPF